jgi:hypothetical protein
MIVNCLIKVVVLVNFGTSYVPMFTTAQVNGKVLNKSEVNYLADFSVEAEIKKYIGDYSKVLVNKDVCVETAVAR